MQTPDGAWRVEAVRRGTGREAARWYRLVHGDNVVDRLTIDMVGELLAKAGIDMAMLTEVDPAA